MMYHEYKKGWIEVISGCMFAGKTEELIRRVRTLQYAKKDIVVVKPSIDNRYSVTEVASHAGSRVRSVCVASALEILQHVKPTTEVVAIDEVQFFDHDIIDVCEHLADKGVRVICAGLDRDFRAEPFGVMPELMTRAEFITKLSAVCVVCGAPATRTQRLVDGKPASYDDPIVLVGASEAYEARCRHCHQVSNKPYNPNIK
jgi:thymidine kinase